jgi:hypothetical protein
MVEETNVQGTQQEENKETSSNIDYGKIEEMVNKGIQQKENGILKSYFSQQGLSEDEMKVAIETYKTNKANKEKEQAANNPDLLKLQEEIKTLKSAAQKEKINNAIQLQAFGMGLNEKAVNAMLKIQAFDDVLDGENISKDKIKTSIEDFLKDYEMFRPQSQSNGFSVEIGAKDENPRKETEEDAMLKAIGLTPKKK